MMKRKITFKLAALAVILTCLFACAAGVLVACNNNKEVTAPRKVEIVLINPNPGEPMKTYGEFIENPPMGTPIEVKIKDAETGEYLTDEDLPGTTLERSLSIGIEGYLDWDDTSPARIQNYRNIWPTYGEETLYYRVIQISIMFDCRPKRLNNSEEFVRKYELTSMSYMFEYV